MNITSRPAEIKLESPEINIKNEPMEPMDCNDEE